jgi:hypothetical protein
MLYRSDLEVAKLLPVALGFELNEHQQEWLSDLTQETFELIVEIQGPRGCGQTSFVLALFAIYSILNPSQVAMVMCKSNQQAASHCQQIKTYLARLYDHFSTILEVELPVPYVQQMKNLIELDNGSQLIFCPESYSYACGRTLNRLFLDFSVKKIEDVDQELMYCVVPCLSAIQGKLLISMVE